MNQPIDPATSPSAADDTTQLPDPAPSHPISTNTEATNTEPMAVPTGFRSPRERRRSRREEIKPKRGAADPWLESLLVVLVVGSVLAIGTAHVRTLLVVATVSVGAAVLALLAHRRTTGTWPVTLPVAGVFVLTLWTAAQAIPLPAGWVELVAPNGADVWKHALDPLGEPGPAWHPISLDPGATWVEVLKGMTYTGVLLLSTVVAFRRGATFGVGTVFVSGLAVGTLTISHGVAGLTKVFGVYEPLYFSSPWQMGPLLNPNHLAGYLNLAVMCGFGILLARRAPVPRWLTGVGVATLLALAVLAASRGAAALLPVGVAFVFLLIWYGDHRERVHGHSSGHGSTVPRRWLGLATVATLAGGAVFAALGFSSTHWRSLFDDDMMKLSILSWARPLVEEHAWVGIGRGAFETVYPAYRPIQGHLLWTHPENIVVQWASEWGVPAALLAFLFFGYLLRPTALGATRSAVIAGAVGGIGVVALQNWVDFSLEMPGITIAVAVVLGSCWGDTRRRKSARTPGLPKPYAMGRHWMAIGYAAIGLLAIGLVAWRGTPTALDDRNAFFEISKTAPQQAAFDPLVRAAMLRHPAEPYLPLVGAERAWRKRDANPIPYLQRVLTRSKRYGRTHLLLAEILFARGANNQALMELKFACQDEPILANRAVELAVQYNTTGKDLDRMVPPGVEGVGVLDTLAAWMHSRDLATAKRFDDMVLRQDPSRSGPRERRTRERITALRDPDHPLCAGEEKRRACADQIQEDTDYIERVDPTSSRASRMKADALVALGKPEAADQVLSNACDIVKDRLVCLRARMPILSSLGRTDDLDAVLDAIAATGCTNAQACAQTQIWIGQVQRNRKNLGAATNAFRRATRYDPQSLGAWIALGDTSTAMGLNAQAAQAYGQASKLNPKDDALKAKYEKARKEATYLMPSPRGL